MYIQHWDEAEGLILALDDDTNGDDGAAPAWTIHVANSNAFYATGLISTSDFPKDCSTIQEVTELLKSAVGKKCTDGNEAWIDLDTNQCLFQIRERSQGLLRVRWRVSLSLASSTSKTMYPFLQLVVRNTLKIQIDADVQKRRTADQATITENWKRSAQQLEGQWSKEKAVLLHNMRILLAEKHKHYVKKIEILESQLTDAKAASANAPRLKEPIPDAPDDLDQLEYDAETVRKLAAGERMEKKKAAPKKKSLVSNVKKPSKSKILPKTNMTTSKDPALQNSTAEMSTTKQPSKAEKIKPSVESEAMQVDEEPKPPAKTRRRKWMDDSSSEDDDLNSRSRGVAPATNKSSAIARRNDVHSSDDDDDDSFNRVRQRRQRGKASRKSSSENAQKAIFAESVSDIPTADDLLQKLARTSSQPPADGEMSDSSTEADIMKQLESMRN